MNTTDLLSLQITASPDSCKINVLSSEKAQAIPSLCWNIKLFFEGHILFESGYCTQDSFELDCCKQFGKYSAFCQAKSVDNTYSASRKCFWIYDKNKEIEYKNWLNDVVPNTCSSTIPLFHLKNPYQVLAAFSYSGKLPDSFIRYCKEELNLCLTPIAKSTYALSQVKPTGGPFKKILFSGKMASSDKLVWGQSEISPNSTEADLLENVGYYTVIFKKFNSNVIFQNDFFGTNSLYTYISDSLSAASNSYHLITLIARKLEQPLHLDITRIIPYFVTGKRMLFEQLASTHSFIKEIRMVPVHNYCEITKNGIELKDKEITAGLKIEESNDKSEYRKLLRRAAKEIRKNCQSVLDNKVGHRVIVDVSGGKDSRLILAAMRNINADPNQVAVRSLDVKEDKQAFIALNHVHQYPYYADSEEMQLVRLSSNDLARRSMTLGTTFSVAIGEKKRADEQPSAIEMLGAGGDYLLCPYYTMSISNIDYTSTHSIATSWAVQYNNGIVNYDKIQKYIAPIIEEGLNETLGNDPYSIMNNYYLYFRNAAHFGIEPLGAAMNKAAERWMPLYSKALFMVRQMSGQHFTGIKIALDLMLILDPDILKYPFSTPSYNQELELLLKNNKKYKKLVGKMEVDLNKDEQEWSDANKLLNERHVIVNPKSEQDQIRKENAAFCDQFYDTLLNRLHRMLSYDSELEEILGLDLYTFITKQKYDYEKHHTKIDSDLIYLNNKVTCFTDLLDIIESV